MSPEAAVSWSPRVARSVRGRRRKAGAKPSHRPPLLEIPTDHLKFVEEVMLALNPEGQKHFKEELHVALEQSKPGAELSFTVAAWMFTKYLVMDREEGRDLRSILKRLPELTKASEDLTLEQFAKRIGLR